MLRPGDVAPWLLPLHRPALVMLLQVHLAGPTRCPSFELGTLPSTMVATDSLEGLAQDGDFQLQAAGFRALPWRCPGPSACMWRWSNEERRGRWRSLP